MQQIRFYAMGCHMTAILDDDTPQGAESLRQVPAWFEEWEQVLSRFREDSELSRLNQLSGSPVTVSQTLWEVFQLSLLSNRYTNGLVSPALLKALQSAGYDRSFSELNPDQPTEFKSDPYTEPELAKIFQDPQERILQLPDGMWLDFGGVAKGWAAQKAAERLGTNAPALVNAGGDIAVCAPPNRGLSWPIGLENPFNTNQQLQILRINAGGVATSGRDFRHWKQNGRIQHHIIDPHSGKPAKTDILAATVIAPDLYQAEAAAKAVLILGSQNGLNWLETKPSLAAILVLENQKILTSSRIKPYLWQTN